MQWRKLKQHNSLVHLVVTGTEKFLISFDSKLSWEKSCSILRVWVVLSFYSIKNDDDDDDDDELS